MFIQSWMTWIFRYQNFRAQHRFAVALCEREEGKCCQVLLPLKNLLLNFFLFQKILLLNVFYFWSFQHTKSILYAGRKFCMAELDFCMLVYFPHRLPRNLILLFRIISITVHHSRLRKGFGTNPNITMPITLVKKFMGAEMSRLTTNLSVPSSRPHDPGAPLLHP